MITSRPAQPTVARIWQQYGPRPNRLLAVCRAINGDMPATQANSLVADLAATVADHYWRAHGHQHTADYHEVLAMAGPGVLCVALASWRPQSDARMAYRQNAIEVAVALLARVRTGDRHPFYLSYLRSLALSAYRIECPAPCRN